MADARLTQGLLLVLAEADVTARITQAVALALGAEPAEEGRVTQAVLLPLYSPVNQGRITQLAALAMFAQEPCLTHWAHCWRIARTDGVVLRFTDHDNNLPFRGETYKPCNSLSASAAELASMIGSVGNLELAGLLADDDINERDLYGGVYDGADVEVWIVPWINETHEFPWRLAAGKVGKVSHSAQGHVMEIVTPGARLQQHPLLQTYTLPCRFRVGDARCGVDLESFRVSGAVTAVVPRSAATGGSRRIFRDNVRAEADDYFNLGTLTWTTGANAGLSMEVKEFTSSNGEFILWQPMLHHIAVGDEYSVVPGCDLLPATCKNTFNNYARFGGFPNLPGQDAMTRTPNSKA